ncbi:unnamed protein product [Withania somnifera]
MDLSNCKQLRFFGVHLNFLVAKCLFLVVIALFLGTVLLPTFSGLSGVIQQNKFFFVHNGSSSSNQFIKRKFLEVPQIVWGLNNQKIAFARACLTARMLNRTLLMPNLSASLFYKEVELLKPISFDKIFQFERFNSVCKGFVQLSRYSDVSNQSDVIELQKGSGRRWTLEKDLEQLNQLSKHQYDAREIVRIVGKNPFLWHDHWPTKDYAKVFECLALVEEISIEADKVVSKIREIGMEVRSKIPVSSSPSQPVPFVAVHMRVEKDWKIHCKKLEQRLNISEICSSKEEIIARVGNIAGLKTPVVIYLAVADTLLEDKTKQPYLFQSAIDYEVCLRSDIFVGNSFSTFSSLVVLDRTQKMIKAGETKLCGSDVRWPSYAYNIRGAGNTPHMWITNMSDTSLTAISYGSNHISC